MDRKIQAPIKPCVDDDKWLDNFHKDFTTQEYRESLFSTGGYDQMLTDYQKEFEEFNYINTDPDGKLASAFQGNV